MITRRHFIAAGAAAGLLGARAPRLWAATEVSLGDATVTTLSDGHLALPESFLVGDLDPEKVHEVVAASGVAAGGLEPPCNLTLLRRDDALVLFDAGSGTGFMPTAGKLPEALDAAGVSAEEITHVIFTHGHPDHLWGVLDDFDEPFFPAAQHLMGGRELAFWSDPATAETIGAERQSFAAGAARRLEVMGDRIQAFDDGETLLPGLRAVMTPGHTPGHMSFEVAGAEGAVMVVGDAIGNGHMALSRPAWHAAADQDPELGAATRQALLARLAEDAMPMVGFHLPGGGLGRIARQGEAYAFTPAG